MAVSHTSREKADGLSRWSLTVVANPLCTGLRATDVDLHAEVGRVIAGVDVDRLAPSHASRPVVEGASARWSASHERRGYSKHATLANRTR
jgi:hypothetical protein